MRISKIFGLIILTNAVAGNYTGKAYKHGGKAIENVSYGLKKIFETTEAIGHSTKKFGEFVEKESQGLEKYARDWLKEEELREEYRNLKDNCVFEEYENWVVVENLRIK